MSEIREKFSRGDPLTKKEKKVYSFVFKSLQLIEESSRHSEVQDFFF